MEEEKRNIYEIKAKIFADFPEELNLYRESVKSINLNNYNSAFDTKYKTKYTNPQAYRNLAVLDGYLGINDEFSKICNADAKRYKRLKSKINNMLKKHKCVFLTLTFNDETLAKTNQQTRRKYVCRFLKDYDHYVSNIDYGAKNGREHYHAIVASQDIDFTKWRKYGNINCQKVRVNSKTTSGKLAHYVSKLTNHAIKETTKRNAIIYSKPKKHFYSILDTN